MSAADTSRLVIDYRNATVDAVGAEHGISDAELDALQSYVTEQHNRINDEHNNDVQRWQNLPDNIQIADEIKAFADEARQKYTDFILIGIGGSSLGAIATIMALCHPYWNLMSDEQREGPRFFVLDNPDPEKVRATLDIVNLETTLVNVVSKSGQTAETAANFLVVRDALVAAVGKEKAAEQIIATTDPETGILRQMANEEGYRTFPVPPGVDGRQTVLSAVGLIPAALAGVDIHALLAGAKAMRERASSDVIRENPAYLLAALSVLADTKKHKSMLVTMPYADALFGISDWFRQLWAESLGKKLSTDGEDVFAGQTPIKALGTIDQHSQVQLYTEGPNDKLIQLVDVEAFRKSIDIPQPPHADLEYLNGGELGQLVRHERLATAWALTQAQRPNLTITVPTIDAGIIGEFFYMMQLQTVMAGALYHVNPFGQPGVEAGKNATYALMGRSGYEDLRSELEQTPADADKYVCRA